MNQFIDTMNQILNNFDAQASWAQIVKTVQNPGANPTVALVIVAFVLVAVLMLVLLMFMFITPASKKVVKVRRYTGEAAVQARLAAEQREAEALASQSTEVSTKVRPAAAALTGVMTTSILLIVAFVGGYVATSTNSYCAGSCHRGTHAVTSADEASHARCTSCHEVGGIFGVPANLVSRGRMMYVAATEGMPRTLTSVVDSRPCLSCHREIGEESTVSAAGLKMSHKAVIEAGRPCVQCHEASGHTTDVYTGTMSTCVPCHDSKTASAQCPTCHEKNPDALAKEASPERTLGSKGFVYPAVRAANRECGGCHDQKKNCDPCHGIRMPHSREFKRGQHARNAAFSKKLSCWKCHDPQWCSNGGCHLSAFSPATGDTTHGENWRQLHSRAAWDAGCICHSQRGTDRTGPICTLCHLPNHDLAPIER